MPTEFYHSPDWQCSSGPELPRQFAVADLWPVGLNSESDGSGDKDILAVASATQPELHPVVAIGAKANRPNNLTGVVKGYTNDHLVTLNLADKVCTRNYVANVLTYSNGTPNTFDTSMAPGDPVYVDDSDSLASGVTLSRSPLNDDGAGNPLAGYLWYCQDDFIDSGVGGLHATAGMPVTLDNELDEETVYCILLVNDSGQARALITE
jgi:hypothetical protein